MLRYLLFLSILFSTNSFGQGFSYWTNQYGVRASFLGGAAVGSVLDNTATYYNPASLGFVDGNSLSVSANTFSVRFIRIEDGLGNDLHLNTTNFTILPQLISGMLKIKKSEKLKVGYILMAKDAFNSDYTVSFNGEKDYIDSIPGKEFFLSSYQASHRFTEIWGGAAVAYRINDVFSVGCSFFLSFTDERVINNLSFRIIPEGNQSVHYASLRTNVDFSYFNFKGVFKPSIAVSLPKFRWGLSGTIPSFNIYGEAKVNRDAEVSNFPQFDGVNFLFTDSQRKIKMKTRFPGSISTGFGIKTGKKGWLHLASEYFFPQNYYLMFDPEDQTKVIPSGLGQGAMDTIFNNQNFLAFGERRKHVVNIGIGYEFPIKETMEIMLGFRTDFNYSYPEDRHIEFAHIKKVGSTWSNYYGSIGLSFVDKKNKHYSVGVELGFTPGGSTVQYINLAEPNLNEFYSAQRKEGTLHDFNLKLIFGVELNWKKKCADCPVEEDI
jgi:hypothetical protein